MLKIGTRSFQVKVDELSNRSGQASLISRISMKSCFISKTEVKSWSGIKITPKLQFCRLRSSMMLQIICVTSVKPSCSLPVSADINTTWG